MSPIQSIGPWLLSNGGILMGGISGLFSIFSGDRKGRLWRILPVIGIIVGLFWALASANYQDADERRKMEHVINEVDEYVTQLSKTTVSQVDTNTRTALAEYMQKYLGVLPAVANNASPARAADIVNAGLLVKESPPDRRAALTIWLFPHVQEEVNFNVVTARLNQLAAKVDIHDVVVRKKVATNSVWWSKGSSLEEAKSVALTVTSAGLQVRQICPSSQVSLPNVIQVGGSLQAEQQDLPVLSASEIEALTLPKCENASPR